jgi:hypothetical protein
MRAPRFLSPLLLAALAIAALAAPASATAHGENELGSSGHDMGAMGAAEHGTSHNEHAGHDAHGATHGANAVAGERPVALLLGGFAALNALVLLAAALMRRRPAAIKRRETLARVRRAAGAREAEPIVEAES